jgi:hypothetical protein
MSTLSKLSGMVAAVVLGTFVGVSSAQAEDIVPDPGTVTIKKITYGGFGCPAGTAAVNISSDGTTFTVIFDQFIAQVGPEIPAGDFRAQCTLNLTLNIPPGFTYAVSKFINRGFASVEPGAYAEQKSTYHFQGQRAQTSAWSRYPNWSIPTRAFCNNPNNASNPRCQNFTTDWITEDEFETATLVYSPCSVESAVNVKSDLRIIKGWSNEYSMMVQDTVDGSFSMQFHFEWQRCTP